MTFDPSADYTLFDGLQTVTYFPALAPNTGLPVNNVLRQQTATQQPETMDRVGKSTVTWHAWGPELTGLPQPPVIGDLIQDTAGSRWLVTKTEFDPIPQHWTLTTLLQRLGLPVSWSVSS